MDIKLTTGEIISSYNAIEEYINNCDDINVDFLWNIDKNQSKFKKIVDRFEKCRNNILKPFYENKAFIEEESTNEVVKVKSEFAEDFAKAVSKINELLAVKNNIEDIDVIDYDTVPKQISGKLYKAIKYMIKK